MCTSQTSNLLYINLQVWQEIEERLLLAIADIKKVSITMLITKYFSFQTNVLSIHEELRKT
ncbi:hypothetical protein [Nostoc sp. 'Peltigera malacea cyanobiont' DB3992]|uniref:hypothetical protein n=1 Tax=Nostoc sp. 'Peltigera malacea cyanobiont' DB3992 TaxID=1206980 RepID=UPI00117F6C34|nr:hypothetical protein [Nostoc sp. 'Peltigera malacea cyanobiont' DB3992]